MDALCAQQHINVHSLGNIIAQLRKELPRLCERIGDIVEALERPLHRLCAESEANTDLVAKAERKRGGTSYAGLTDCGITLFSTTARPRTLKEGRKRTIACSSAFVQAKQQQQKEERERLYTDFHSSCISSFAAIRRVCLQRRQPNAEQRGEWRG